MIQYKLIDIKYAKYMLNSVVQAIFVLITLQYPATVYYSAYDLKFEPLLYDRKGKNIKSII